MGRRFYGRTVVFPGLVLAMLHGAALAANAPGQMTEPAVIELANDQVAIGFDIVRGTVASIRNRAAGVDYMVGPPAPCLFSLKYLTPGNQKKRLRTLVPPPGALRSHKLVRQDGRSTLQLGYRVPSDAGGLVQVTCEATLPDDGDEIRWRIAVDNQAADFEIVEVIFPVLGGLCLAERSEDNFLTWPTWAGRLIRQPQRNGPRSGSYCGGRATMAWIDLYLRRQDSGSAEPNACGLYLASHDPTLLMTGLASEPAEDGDSLTLQMSKFAHVRKGQHWASRDFVTRKSTRLNSSHP